MIVALLRTSRVPLGRVRSLLRLDKTQEQKREHVAQTQAEARAHRELILDLEHQAVQDAAITRQKALNEQKYEHRKRILKLERQYASTEIAVEPRRSISESENAGPGNEDLEDQRRVGSTQKTSGNSC